MANQNERKREKMFLIHSLIGVGIMVFFRFLPLNLPEVTSVGMEVLGIFIGTLYLWTFVDPLWGEPDVHRYGWLIQLYADGGPA